MYNKPVYYLVSCDTNTSFVSVVMLANYLSKLYLFEWSVKSFEFFQVIFSRYFLSGVNA